MRKLLLCAFACLFALKSDARTCFLPMSDSCFPATSTSVQTDCPEGYATNVAQCIASNAACDNGWWLDTTRVLQFSGGKRCYLCTQSHLPTDCNIALSENVCALRGLGFSQEDLCVGDEVITCNRCVGTPCPEDHSLTADLTCDGSQHIQTFSQNALCGKCVCKDGYHTSVDDCGSSGSSGWTFTKDNSSDMCGKCEAKTCETHNLVATCLTSNYTEHLHWLGDNQEICYDCKEDEVVCNDGYDKIEDLTCNTTSQTTELQPNEPRCAKCVCNANKNYVSSCQQGFSCQSPVDGCVKVTGCAADYQNTICAADLAQFGPYQLAGHTCWRCGPTCQSLGYQQSGSCSDSYDAENYTCQDSSPQTDAYGSICRTLTLKTCDKLKCQKHTATITELEDGTGITCEVYDGFLSSISFRDTPQTGDIRAIVRSKNSNSSVECYTNEIQTCQSLGYEHKGSCLFASYDTYFFDCTESPMSARDFWNNYCHNFVPKTCVNLHCRNTAQQSDGTFVCTASADCSSNGCLWDLTDDTSKTPVTVQSGTDPSDTKLCYSSQIKTCQTEGYPFDGRCPNENAYDSNFYDCQYTLVYTNYGSKYCYKLEPKTCRRMYCNNLIEHDDGSFSCTAASVTGYISNLDAYNGSPITVFNSDATDSTVCSANIKTCKTEGYQSEGTCPSHDPYMYSCSSSPIDATGGIRTCHTITPKTCNNLYCKNLTEQSDGTFVCTASARCTSDGCLQYLGDDTSKTPVTVQSSTDPSDTKLCYSEIKTCKTEGYQHEGKCPSQNTYDARFYGCEQKYVSTSFGYQYCYKLTPLGCASLKCNNLIEHENGSFSCTAASCPGDGCITYLNVYGGSPITVFNSDATDSTVCSADIRTCQTEGYQFEGECPNANTYNSFMYSCSQSGYISTSFGLKKCHKFEPRACSSLKCNNLTEHNDGSFTCTQTSSCSGAGCLTSLNDDTSKTPVTVQSSTDPSNTKLCYSEIKTCKTEGYQHVGRCPNQTDYDAKFYSCQSQSVSTSFGSQYCYKLTPLGCASLKCNNVIEHENGRFSCTTASCYSIPAGNGCISNLNVYGGSPITVFNSDATDSTVCTATIRTCKTLGYQYEGQCPNTYDSFMYSCSQANLDTTYGRQYCHKFEPRACSSLKCNNLTEHNDGSFTCTHTNSCSGAGCLTSLNDDTSKTPVTVQSSTDPSNTMLCYSSQIKTCKMEGYTGTGKCPTYNGAFYTCKNISVSTSFGSYCYQLTPKTCGTSTTNIRYCTGLFNDGGTYKCQASSSSCSGSGCARNLSNISLVGAWEIHVYENLNNPDSEHLVCYTVNVTL